MRVFITGGTGYLGAAVVAALIKAGHQVTGLSRSLASDATLSRSGARAVRGRLGALSGLLPLLGTQDALIHAAVDYGLGPAADREAVAAMLEGARASGRPSQVVYTSGVWVLGPCPSPTDERGSTAQPAAAVAWRPAHEQLALGAATDLVAVAVIRPGIVYGERRGLVAPWFGQAASGGAAQIVGDGSNRWPLVHRDDLAALYVRVVEDRARGVVHGVDGQAPTVREAAQAASRAAGAGGVVSTPLDSARASLGAMADALAMDQVVVSARAAELGWRPSHPPFLEAAAAARGEAAE
jgi:nucleoside-diphosphate-sugar epimerase